MDEGHRRTDRLLSNLERRIYRIYADAAQEKQKEIEEFFAYFEKRDEELRQQVEDGVISEEYYRQWRLNQMGRGERFERLRDDLAMRMTIANEVAAAYINDVTPGIYSLNRNFVAYTIEKVHGAVGFNILDEQTVKRLIVDSPNLMPHYPKARAVKRGIDLEYGKKQITNQVTSGILRGSSIKDIAESLMDAIPGMNRSSAVRAARTAITNAECAGRQAGFEAAAELGIQVRKRWIATKDFRTRHAHGKADGQIVPHNQPFKVDGYDMMYPGDNSAPGYLVYNCRCTVATVEKEGIEAEPRKMRVKNAEGRNVLVNEMTYDEWVEWVNSRV